jgi:erythromycin esterase-like protein
MPRAPRSRRAEPPATAHLGKQLRTFAQPLAEPHDLEPLLARVGDARFALLGEASHGTSDFYRWRAEISARLIVERGFSFVAVEGDWPDCYRLNRYVKGYRDAGRSAREVLEGFGRWPTWMWANEEIVAFAEWLRRHNETLPLERRVGFYGLDVYSLWDSLAFLQRHLARHEPAALPEIRRVVRCFEPYDEDAQAYARATVFHSASCEDQAAELLQRLRRDGGARPGDDGGEAAFVAEQNAWVVRNAESYYRAMVRHGPDSWNIRDRHMLATLQRLVAFHGAHAKALVWEHNTHVGDARFTDMIDGGQINVGQLARERWGEDDVVLVGFSTHRGTVIAGREWEAPMQTLPCPPARPGSWEQVLHDLGGGNRLLVFSDVAPTEELLEPRGHRAVGVVYHPEYEHLGNYVPTVLPRRYDALLHLDLTEALHPLAVRRRERGETPETFPSAM